MSHIDAVLVTEGRGALRGTNVHQILLETYGLGALYVETDWDDYVGRVMRRGRANQIGGRTVTQAWDVLDYVTAKGTAPHRTR